MAHDTLHMTLFSLLIVFVLLLAHIERLGVSHMRDFLLIKDYGTQTIIFTKLIKAQVPKCNCYIIGVFVRSICCIAESW